MPRPVGIRSESICTVPIFNLYTVPTKPVICVTQVLERIQAKHVIRVTTVLTPRFWNAYRPNT